MPISTKFVPSQTRDLGPLEQFSIVFSSCMLLLFEVTKASGRQSVSHSVPSSRCCVVGWSIDKGEREWCYVALITSILPMLLQHNTNTQVYILPKKKRASDTHVFTVGNWWKAHVPVQLLDCNPFICNLTFNTPSFYYHYWLYPSQWQPVWLLDLIVNF